MCHMQVQQQAAQTQHSCQWCKGSKRDARHGYAALVNFKCRAVHLSQHLNLRNGAERRKRDISGAESAHLIHLLQILVLGCILQLFASYILFGALKSCCYYAAWCL
jgi:hypothetical protein